MKATPAKKLLHYIQQELTADYGHEAESLAMLIVEAVSGLNPTEIRTGKPFLPAAGMQLKVDNYIARLKAQEPVQYILGKAWFHNNYFLVKPGVLIPRPETEELVVMVVRHLRKLDTPKVLDIGTGSGCIAISLALEVPEARVSGLDKSNEALAVARQNNKALNAGVEFFQEDIFTYKASQPFDVLVSNPPYVRESEKKEMNRNVLDYEPGMALFVPDNKALIFYETIVQFAKKGLASGGELFFEVNQYLAEKVADLLRKDEYSEVQIKVDLNGNNRFVRGRKP